MPLSKNDLSALVRTSASIPGHEADDNVPAERVHETTPRPTKLQLEGVVEGEEDGVRGTRGNESGC